MLWSSPKVIPMLLFSYLRPSWFNHPHSFSSQVRSSDSRYAVNSAVPFFSFLANRTGLPSGPSKKPSPESYVTPSGKGTSLSAYLPKAWFFCVPAAAPSGSDMTFPSLLHPYRLAAAAKIRVICSSTLFILFFLIKYPFPPDTGKKCSPCRYSSMHFSRKSLYHSFL